MKVNVGIWDKLSRLVVCLLFVAALLWVFYWYLPLIRHNQKLRRDLLALDNSIREQERLAKHLKESIDSVQSDPRTFERLLREKLGYSRSNETVIVFEGPGATRTRSK